MQLSAKAQESFDRVIRRFQSGDLSPIRQVARIRLDPNAPACKWSLSNRIMAYVQTDELDCRGFKQWQDVGRSVKKGSRAAYILRPHIIKQSQDKNEDQEEKTMCTGFSPVPVFAISDTEGNEALPIYEPREIPPLLDVAQKFGIAVSYVPATPNKLGDTDTKGQRIRLGTQDPSIFFHELAHAIHARLAGELKGGQHNDQETIAEFTSAVLMDFYGYQDKSGNAWAYISGYAKDPLVAITRAMGTVEKVLAVLIDNDKMDTEKE